MTNPENKPCQRTLDSADTEAILANLDAPFRATLLSMYNGDPQRGMDGQLHPLDKKTKIPPQQGMWIYDLCVATKPEATLEIGMAFGFSALFFLAAIAKNQSGHHTAIDPLQHSLWKGIGLITAREHLKTMKDGSAFSFIEDYSERVATDLARANKKYDVIFIDGNHRFDNVLLDFYLYAQLCNMGGYIIFDDMWMNSIKTAVEFIRTNRRDFDEIHPTPHNVTVFQKVGEDQRKWNHFTEFKVFPSAPT